MEGKDVKVRKEKEEKVAKERKEREFKLTLLRVLLKSIALSRLTPCSSKMV